MTKNKRLLTDEEIKEIYSGWIDDFSKGAKNLDTRMIEAQLAKAEPIIRVEILEWLGYNAPEYV